MIETGTGIARYEYRPDSPIGDGGFAFVYCAHEKEGNADVALKILKPEYEENSSAIASFFRDPQIVQKLDHPNIVRILDIGQSDQRPYFFAMEYCRMGDLKKQIQRKKRLPIANALRYAMAVCDALRHCHEAELFHGDIKASNILFRNSETPLLSDFGNAVDKFQLQTAVNEERNIGSPPYMSPEVWELKGYNAASDLYSFGVLLYYMLTGVLPFSGETAEEQRRMHLYTTPSAPSRWRASITQPLDAVILSLLEKRPGERITTAEEVHRILKEIYQQSYEGIEAHAESRLSIFMEEGSKNGLTVREFPFRIGKTEQEEQNQKNHLVVQNDDPFISRFHAVIEKFEDGYFFIDVSTNGSWVNGVRLRKQSIELLRENTVLIGKETKIVIRIIGDQQKEERDSTTTILGLLDLNPRQISEKKFELAFAAAGMVLLAFLARFLFW